MASRVVVALRVKASPLRAFEAFTAEIGQWWRPNALFAFTPRAPGVLSFDGRERLIETREGARCSRSAGSASGTPATHRLP